MMLNNARKQRSLREELVDNQDRLPTGATIASAIIAAALLIVALALGQSGLVDLPQLVYRTTAHAEGAALDESSPPPTAEVRVDGSPRKGLMF